MSGDDGTEAMPLCELAEYQHYCEWRADQGFDHIAEAKAELEQLHGVLDQLDDDA